MPNNSTNTNQKVKRVNFVNIEFCNGLKVYQKQIDYVQLKQLVEKLEALC